MESGRQGFRPAHVLYCKVHLNTFTFFFFKSGILFKRLYFVRCFFVVFRSVDLVGHTQALLNYCIKQHLCIVLGNNTRRRSLLLFCFPLNLTDGL